MIVGLDDKQSGAAAFLGTDLDSAWLRKRVCQLTSPSLVVSARQRVVDRVRLLVLLVPRNHAGEPHAATVSKSGGKRKPRRVDMYRSSSRSILETRDWVISRRSATAL